MICSVDNLVGTDTVGVVEEFDYRVGFLHLFELTAVPGEVIPVIGGGVADLVVGNGRRTNGGQLVALLPAEQNALRVFNTMSQ